jgi:hypothetical protein
MARKTTARKTITLGLGTHADCDWCEKHGKVAWINPPGDDLDIAVCSKDCEEEIRQMWKNDAAAPFAAATRAADEAFWMDIDAGTTSRYPNLRY